MNQKEDFFERKKRQLGVHLNEMQKKAVLHTEGPLLLLATPGSGKTTNIIEIIDLTIKQVWINQIKNDYQNFYLLKEDTLKNALYFHIRNQLTDKFLSDNNIRIYTEFHYKNSIADIAIVHIKDNQGEAHLKDRIDEVIAVIEIKYKSNGNVSPFESDIVKVARYIEGERDFTQYYLAFIHEIE